MKTEIIKIDPNNIDMNLIKRAAVILKEGGLVAFPTETVYGLGANALNLDAVSRIFKAKGRPCDNPLIVHISDKAHVNNLVSSITSRDLRLFDEFWPGPLTLIMSKSFLVPEIVSAGLSTVAIRMPAHTIALALIREAGVPIAAPSANTSGRPSPTLAKHVIEDLYGKVDVIIDGGASNIGLESTVLDITCNTPIILRPGGITKDQLLKFLDEVEIDRALLEYNMDQVVPKCPGQKYTHYSPKAEVIIIKGSSINVRNKINELAIDYTKAGVVPGILATEQTKHFYEKYKVISAGDVEVPETIASNLFNILRNFDELGVGVILAEAFDIDGIGLAIMNRLTKAAGYNIINV